MTINAFLEARKAELEAHRQMGKAGSAEYQQAHMRFVQAIKVTNSAARYAAPEIEELRDLLRKYTHPFCNTSIKDTPIIIPPDDADRIREIVGGGE